LNEWLVGWSDTIYIVFRGRFCDFPESDDHIDSWWRSILISTRSWLSQRKHVFIDVEWEYRHLMWTCWLHLSHRKYFKAATSSLHTQQSTFVLWPPDIQFPI